VLAKSGSDDLADDGVLQLFEILDLTLRSPVVVLSACETHRGPEVAGEGVAALSRAFIVAGAAEVIGSLWSVDDASTAKLMGAFFDSMGRQARRSRPLDIDVALRNAKRVVRADPRSQAPFFWSAFLMVGAR
jgi:CHAT domain-containing protein